MPAPRLFLPATEPQRLRVSYLFPPTAIRGYGWKHAA
jgi:hypothetical protein